MNIRDPASHYDCDTVKLIDLVVFVAVCGWISLFSPDPECAGQLHDTRIWVMPVESRSRIVVPG